MVEAVVAGGEALALALARALPLPVALPLAASKALAAKSEGEPLALELALAARGELVVEAKRARVRARGRRRHARLRARVPIYTAVSRVYHEAQIKSVETSQQEQETKAPRRLSWRACPCLRARYAQLVIDCQIWPRAGSAHAAPKP